MKKAINAVVALGPISLFVFTPLFMAPSANACEGWARSRPTVHARV
jgi:hypothetical protein